MLGLNTADAKKSIRPHFPSFLLPTTVLLLASHRYEERAEAAVFERFTTDTVQRLRPPTHSRKVETIPFGRAPHSARHRSACVGLSQISAEQAAVRGTTRSALWPLSGVFISVMASSATSQSSARMTSTAVTTAIVMQGRYHARQ